MRLVLGGKDYSAMSVVVAASMRAEHRAWTTFLDSDWCKSASIADDGGVVGGQNATQLPASQPFLVVGPPTSKRGHVGRGDEVQSTRCDSAKAHFTLKPTQARSRIPVRHEVALGDAHV